MEIPEGFPQQGGRIVKVLKALYGLNQSPARFNKEFKETLKELGLLPLENHLCILTNKAKTIYLAIHVDDGIILSQSSGKPCAPSSVSAPAPCRAPAPAPAPKPSTPVDMDPYTIQLIL